MSKAWCRIRRYIRVSTAMGGVGLRFGANRLLGAPLDRNRNAAALRAALGGIKGPLMKVAQLMATIPDAMPSEYVTELAQLQANAPAMGWAFVKRRMATELGADWRQRFAEFESEAVAAASLGQVHRARSHDGTALACKLQYPDMCSAVEADLAQLRLVFALYHRYDKAIESGGIQAEIADRLREELDYHQESRHMRLYAAMLAGEDHVHVPLPVAALSTGRLLTMNWLEGEPLMAWTKRDQADRDRLATNMFRAWYVPFYGYAVIHGDPHLGNYSVRPDGSLNLLDYGCIRIFEAKFVGGVIDLYHALQTDDEALAVHAYETWGFTGLSKEIIDVLNLWAYFVYDPILDDRARRIQTKGEGTAYGAQVAAKVHRELRRLGGVSPPREFVYMDRAAIGLGSVFVHLAAQVNWHALFEELIEGFDLTVLRRRQAAMLKKFDLPLPG
ncbi:MAG: AarF/ABC1/UbiB kinase family protein [Proteobacteria bacterium]|nr:AarF/ABC1/UbiB kinase family protein [Pseudomonadota bacterium]